MSEQPATGNIPDWTLGWRMQRALAFADVSVEEIADEIGVSRSTVSRWLNDRGSPPRSGYLTLWAWRTKVDQHWLRDGQAPGGPRDGTALGREAVTS
jgi:AraC-like DNA-binding protein